MKHYRLSRSHLFLLAIVGIGLLLRVWRIGAVPLGITLDEMGYVYNAYTLAQTGYNVFGERLPLLTYHVQSGFPFMPVPTYLLAAWFSIVPLASWSARLPNAVLGTLSIVLVYILSRALWRKQGLALASALALGISPWHIFFSRTAYDVTVAAFFYLASLTAFVAAAGRPLILMLSVMTFLLGLFSYRGMAALAPGLIGLYVWHWLRHERRLAYLFTCIGMIAALMLFVAVGWKYKDRGFFAEAMPNKAAIEEQIELQSRDAQASRWIERMFLNKPMVLLDRWGKQYVAGYDPLSLFFQGEGSQTYSMWMRGKQYVVDALILLIGFCFLLGSKKERKFFSVTAILFLISGLPGLVGGQPYGTRNLFLTVPIALLVGAGVYWLITMQKFRRVAIVCLVSVYGFSISHFLFDYYSRYAYDRAENWAKSLKDVSMVAAQALNSPDRSVVVAGTSFGDVLQYAFYANLDPQRVQRAWQERAEMPYGLYVLDGISFIDRCTADLSQRLNGKMTLIVHPECLPGVPPQSVIADYQKNTIWKIYTGVE